MNPLEDRLEEIAHATQTLFPDFDFLKPDGVLLLRFPELVVKRLRIDLPTSHPLHLQSLGLTTADGTSAADLAAQATVKASAWHLDTEKAFGAGALFDFDHPAGTAIHTGKGHTPWIEVTFDNPVALSGISLRNVGDQYCTRAQGIRVQAETIDSGLTTLYDGAERAVEMQKMLDELAAQPAPEMQEHMPALMTILGHTIAGRYSEARASMKAAKELPADARADLRRAVNSNLLTGRSVEWTAHGPQRSFRFWTEQEKLKYIEFAVAIVEDLKELTPNVAFGFGAALAVVRDGDLIPHDDDLDLIVGFEPHEAETLPEAHARIEEFLRGRGYRVTGDFFAHRHVTMPGHKKLDVFVGLFEGDKVSWYPGARGSLDRDTMFPASSGNLLGVACPLPRNPLDYLETLYGPSWRHPDPGFKHTWSKKPFADQTGGAAPARKAAARKAEPEPPQGGWRARLRRS